MARAASTRCLTTAEDSGTVVLRSSSKWQRRHLRDDVDAVEQRAGDASQDRPAPRPASRCTAREGSPYQPQRHGFMAHTSMKSARVRSQSRLTREIVTMPVLKRLAHDLERLASEFRQLIEEQHAAGVPVKSRPGAAWSRRPSGRRPRSCGAGCGRAGGAPAGDSGVQQAHDGVDLRDLQRLLAASYPAGWTAGASSQHALARARRADEQAHYARLPPRPPARA